MMSPAAVWSWRTALALPLAGAGFLSIARFFQLDEFVFVRCAWLISGGALPYRDFFDHHTPLFYSLLAPFIGIAPESPAALIVGRLVSFGLLLVLLRLVFLYSRQLGSRRGAFLASTFLLTFQMFIARAIEIRPDLLASVCFLGAGWLLLRPSTAARWEAAGAGTLVALAVLSTQKSVYFLWGFAVLVLVDLVRLARRRDEPRALMTRSPLAFLIGVGATGGLFVIYLVATGSWDAFVEQNVVLALQWNATERSFPATTYLLPAFFQTPHWFLAVLAAAAATALPQVRQGFGGRRWLIYACLAVPAIGSLWLNPIPWPYNFLPVFAVLTPMIALLPTYFETRSQAKASAWIWLVALAAVTLGVYATQFRLEVRRSNQGQKESLATVLAATEPDDAIFDDNGGYIFRPAAYQYWYHSGAMRGLMYDHFAETMVPSILDRQAAAWIVDVRFYDLPENVRNFLQGNYLRYSGAIFLPGAAYQVPANLDGVLDLSFLAVSQGDYFLDPQPAIAGVSLSVDGRVVTPASPFELTHGPHEITVEGDGSNPTFLLFALARPANGELWKPLPGKPPKHYPWGF